MSQVLSFTLRDLNRQPARVLEAVRRYGIAEVRTRRGEVFTVVPKTSPKSGRAATVAPDFQVLWRKQRELGHVPPPARDSDWINRVIGGEA